MAIEGLPPEIEAHIDSPGDVLINRMFSMTDPGTLLAKLSWHRRLIIESRAPTPVRAWAMMDFAVAAAHMVDWIFHALSPEQRAAFVMADGRPITLETDFAATLGAHSPELHACVVIANAIKHHTPRSHKNAAVYTWIVSCEGGMEAEDPMTGDWETRIFCGGKVWRDEDFASEVLGQWIYFVHALGLFNENIPDILVQQVRKNRSEI